MTEPGPSSRSRRAVLRRGAIALAGMASLAGCVEEMGEEFPPNTKTPVSERVPELPVTEKTDKLEEGITAMADEGIDDPESFGTAIEEYGIEVESVEVEFDVLTIEYINTELYEYGNIQDVAPIAGAYAALIDSGYGATALEITILDAAASSFGAAEIGTGLAEQYISGEFTAKEYGELVAETIESKRHPPDVGATPDE